VARPAEQPDSGLVSAPVGKPDRVQPTSARGRKARAALLDAARGAFVERGYSDVTAKIITSRAGVSYGSFYIYFTSVEDIFREVAADLQEQIYQASRAPRTIRGAAERLTYETRRYFELYRENAALFQQIDQVARTDPAFGAQLRDSRREYVGRVTKSLQKLQRDGVMDSALDAAYTAHALGAMAERMAFLSSVDQSLDVERSFDIVATLWRQVLGIDEST
jgi:AcrR family transcriptional regulator